MTLVLESESKIIKNKQKELGLSDEQCNKIIEYLKIGFTFSDAESDFEGFVLDWIDRRSKVK
jgi:hypothetical protein